MEPSVLTVYKCPFPKVRIGKQYDGGYIIAEIPNHTYSILISGGIGGDISFEEGFVNKFNTTCFAFDGTIDKISSKTPNITFIKKNIGNTETDKLTNLHDLIDKHESIFIKMDIEGGEIPWLESLSDSQLNKVDQFVMEFHRPFSNREIPIFDKLNKNHVLVHFHGNNCCGVRTHKNVIIPNIFECTYIHKKFLTSPKELNTDIIPGPLDMKNVTKHDEIFISHPPFVN